MAKVAPERIDEVVVDTKFFYDDTLTIAVLTLENGFKVVGVSACADPKEYNKELGEELAVKDAKRQIWPLEGYLLKDHLAFPDTERRAFKITGEGSE